MYIKWFYFYYNFFFIIVWPISIEQDGAARPMTAVTAAGFSSSLMRGEFKQKRCLPLSDVLWLVPILPLRLQ